MEITRTLVAGAMGLALVVGGVGCGQAAEKATEEAVEEAAEAAVEESGDCEEVDIGSDGSFSGSCNGTDIETEADGDVDVSSEEGGFGIGSGADLPEGWPADLEVIEGLELSISADDEFGLGVNGNMDGDLTETADQVRADIEAADFTLEDEVTEDEGDGRMSTSFVATNAEFEARIAVTETPNDPHGNLTIAYYLEFLAP